MQSASSRIWTRVAVFISYDDNNYTTGTSNTFIILMCPDGFVPYFGYTGLKNTYIYIYILLDAGNFKHNNGFK